MRTLRPLFVAVPAFLLGSLATALLTTTARGQQAFPSGLKDAPPFAGVWEYCGESALSTPAGGDRRYTLRHRR